MPKVTDGYKKVKREHILLSASNVLKRKPLYDLTMTDVIKEAGISKGGIYLYFKNIDEVLIETINYITKDLEPFVMPRLNMTDAKQTLIILFEDLGEYMDRGPSIFGKIRFELMILVFNHPEKFEAIMPHLTIQQFGGNFMSVVEKVILNGIEEGVFSEKTDHILVMNNVHFVLDGLMNAMVFSSYKGIKGLNYPAKDLLSFFVKGIINTLEE